MWQSPESNVNCPRLLFVEVVLALERADVTVTVGEDRSQWDVVDDVRQVAQVVADVIDLRVFRAQLAVRHSEEQDCRLLPEAGPRGVIH